MIYNILFYDIENFILRYSNKNWNIKYLIKNKITDFNALSKFKYINQDIIDKYSNKPWDWKWLIENNDIKVEKYISFHLIKKYSYKWNYWYLSKNPNLIEEFILKYPYQDWNIEYLINNNKIINFKALTKFKNIDEDIIDNCPNKPWDWEWLIENTAIIIEEYIPLILIEKYNYKLCYWDLSKNLNINEEFILKYPYQNWDIEYLIKNNKITDFNILSKFKNINTSIINKYPNNPWDWIWLIENTETIIEKYIPLNLIEKYNYKLCYWNLSKNLNITEEFILKYPYQNWDIEYLIENNKITDFNSLSKFKNINKDIIDKYSNKSWNLKWLIENTNIDVEKYISLELFKKYKNKWGYNDLSKILNINEEFILKYPYQNWDIEYLIKNNKITDFKVLSKFKYINQDFIDKYPNKPWDWEWLIENTNINVKRYIPFNLIEKYKNKWGYWDLSKNLNLTEEFILKYPHQNWDIEYLIDNNKITDFKVLSKFKYINQDFIDKYPNNPWDWIWLIENTGINIKRYIPFNLIEKYKNKWGYWDLSKNLNLTEEFILKYPYKNWDIEYLIDNNKITDFKVLSKFKNINNSIINKYPNNPWNWIWLIENNETVIEKYIPLNLIEKYNYKLYYWNLSKNLNITEEFILKYPYQDWNIEYLIENNKITDFKTLTKFKHINKEIINKYSNKPWDWGWLIENTNINVKKYISLELFKKYKNKWNYNDLSKILNLNEEFILKYPNKDWNIEYLIKNNKITNFKALTKFKNIDEDIIDNYPNKPWDWEWLIENTDINVKRYIPFNLIEKYKNKWGYWALSKNLNLTEEFILKYPNKPWDIIYLIKNNKITNFKLLSRFKYIDKNIINNYPGKPWDWEWLIENTDINVKRYIPFNLIEKYNYNLCYWNLSKNLNINEEFILKYPYQNWDIEYLIENNKITDFNSLSKFKNINKDIIDKYPNKSWNLKWLIENTDINVKRYIPFNLIEKYNYNLCYWNLSKNLNLTEEFILKYPYKNWDIDYLIENNKITDFNSLSKFKNINKDIIDKYPNKSWNLKWLIENTNIDVEKYIPLNLIEKYNYKLCYWNLSKNLNLTEEFILKYPYKNWNIGYLIENNKITDFKTITKFKHINKKIIDKYSNKPWNWEWLIENTNINVKRYIPFNLIEKYKNKWGYWILSKNLNLTEEFILKYPYKIWDIEYLIENNKITDFNALSKFKYIDKEIIDKYSNKPWDWEWLIENTDINVKRYIPFNLIEKYKNKWSYWNLSKNLNLTEEFILKYPYKNWDIEYLIDNNKIINFNTLSKFKNINQDIIDQYSYKQWNWKWLIENTDINVEYYISLDLIEKYKYKWNYWKLSYNSNLIEEFILKYPYQNWNIDYLIKNNKITDFKLLTKFKYINQYIIEKYSNKPWDWKWLIKNININIDIKYIPFNIIKKYLYKLF